jgi:hypothetical protein
LGLTPFTSNPLSDFRLNGCRATAFQQSKAAVKSHCLPHSPKKTDCLSELYLTGKISRCGQRVLDGTNVAGN